MLANLMRWWRRRNTLGARGERQAQRYLRQHGYRLLARNLRTPLGEIDLLAEDPALGHLVIVEVKAATSDAIPPERHVDHRKQAKLTTLGKQLLKRYRLQNRLIRFDVIGIVWPDGSPQPTRLTHHINAFESRR